MWPLNVRFSWFLLNIFLISKLASSTDTLQQLHIIFRHGERSPTKTYPTDPHINYKWEGGWGQLTNKGKLQMYTLGQNLKAHYKHFIPSFYSPMNVSVQSSYADRCQMSAQLVTAALFPPIGEQIWNEHLLWQPVPVSYVPRSQDNYIAMKQNCEKYDKIYEDLLNSEEVTKIKSDHKELFDYLTEHTGSTITTLAQVETLYNTLQIEQLNNLTLPSWVHKDMMEKMKILGAKNLALYSDNEYMKRMKGGMWLKTVLDSMNTYVKDKHGPSINLYSGHDFSLVQILRALNLVDLYKPEFGNTVALELHQNNIVKIHFWDNFASKPIPKSIKACEQNCPLDKFMTILKPHLPLNWMEECKQNTTK